MLRKVKQKPLIDKSKLAFDVKKPVREKRRGDSKMHLEWIRHQPPVIGPVFGEAVDPHHLLRVPLTLGGCRGAGMKNPDIFAMPLPHLVHMALHDWNNEPKFLKKHANIDDAPRFVLEKYALHSPDPEIVKYAKELLG